mgnify:CR=1 FL=1
MKNVIPYLFVGGLFAGVVDGYAVDRCAAHLPAYEVFLLAAAWPAAIGIALTTKSTGGELCTMNQPMGEGQEG